MKKDIEAFAQNLKDVKLEKAWPALAMAWIGIDVHAWHKHLAYQVAVYSLLMAFSTSYLRRQTSLEIS
ncbi:hypothetical protein AAHA92_09473 [Salvia divinorum]|uniref:Uncharacterized protein n=1 Tax=Salvia divinorum TaxID=28513 RepID=A0ABD1HRG4_SALDI